MNTKEIRHSKEMMIVNGACPFKFESGLNFFVLIRFVA